MSRRAANRTGASTTPPEVDDVDKIFGKRTRAPAGLMDISNTMRQDFEGYGFNTGQVQALLALEEPAVDAYAQIAHGRYARQRKEAEQQLGEFLRKREGRESKRVNAGQRKGQTDIEDGMFGSANGGGGKARYQIYLDGSKSWVLFDPTRGWPPTMMSQPPAAYDRFSRYTPGNSKIVAYNTESFAVTLRRTPDVLKGFSVQYSKGGPKLAKIKRGSS